MRFPVFLTGMVLAAAAVGIWGMMAGAGLGTLALMVAATLFVAQILYLGLILLMGRDVARQRRDPAKTDGERHDAKDKELGRSQRP